MKTLPSLLVTLCIVAPCAKAQISFNVVGYYNKFIYTGDNLIANQLDDGTNRLSDLFTSQYLQNGATFTKWDSAANQFLPVSTFNGVTRTWSIDYTFTFGEGASFHSPSGFTNTFLGQVFPGFDVNTGTLNWHPAYTPGLHLIASPIPTDGTFPGLDSFHQAVGRGPLDGEWVKTLDPLTQTYTITTYHSGSGWDNGVPNLQIGQAAWFDLATVPEPSFYSLACLALAFLLRGRRRA
jgi:hypothetical protein